MFNVNTKLNNARAFSNLSPDTQEKILNVFSATK